MPYTKTVWTDEVPATTPIKYKISQTTSGDITPSAEIELVTSVTAGTPVNATNLNKLETGVEIAQAAAEAAQTTATAAIPKSLVTAVGDLIYATASAVLTRLAKPSVDSILKMTSAGTPSWKALTELVSTLIYRRQGNSTTHWDSSGTTNYTPNAANVKIQTGTISFAVTTLVGGRYGNQVTITLPVAYTYRPLVFCSIYAGVSSGAYVTVASGSSNNNSQIVIEVESGVSLTTIYVNWMTIGE